ncbi:2'-deoxycytidine 5'-triphosphate deaminase [Candidatus Woesearchaeota archaeon]|nr:2'-deoxycytidine 5'-triphosphate deaminase [Candidatus Woesearchaeota archaeon]
MEIGVYNKNDIKLMIDNGLIYSDEPIDAEKQIQPSSFEPRIQGKICFIGKSILPRGRSMTQILKERSQYAVEKNDRIFLDYGKIYIIPLMEKLKLPKGCFAKASSKSSIGRLAILTRLITEDGHLYNNVSDGYEGQLYIEFYSMKFNIIIKKGISLNQIRFFYNGTGQLANHELMTLFHANKLYGAISDRKDVIKDNGVLVTCDLSEGVLRAKEGETVDLTVDFDIHGKTNLLKFGDYWHKEFMDKRGEYTLRLGEFYIIKTKENLIVPLDYVAELKKFEETLGEISVHEAGFVHPGWGLNRVDKILGTPLILETTVNKVPFTLSDGDPIAYLNYHKLLNPLDEKDADIKTPHHYQGLNPGKIFIED